MSELMQALERDGWILFTGAAAADPDRIIAGVGTVLRRSTISADGEATSLACSPRELTLHTDHARADYIAWICVAPALEGGETLLLDARRAWALLDEETRSRLRAVRLMEHRIFADDPAEMPMIREVDGETRFYYSYWLRDAASDADEQALTRWRETVAQVPMVRLRLQTGDVLVIDNRRMLHGRTAFAASSGRRLERFWIRAVESEFALPPELRRVAQLEFPEPISCARIRELREARIDEDIASIDLSMVKMKLCDPTEGKGWSHEVCERVEVAYKRFLQLNRSHPDARVVPTVEIDTMWHYHILDTRAYIRDCTRVFGEYFHHYPYFGMRGEEDAEALERAFRESEALWTRTFGDSLAPQGAADCWHDCQGRCWHACSNKAELAVAPAV